MRGIGDAGTQLVLDCGSDVSAATARSIKVRRLDGATTTWAATASGSNAIQVVSLAAPSTKPAHGAFRPRPRCPLASGWESR